MNRSIHNVLRIWLVIFLVVSAGVAAYEWFWVRPEKLCDQKGYWFDPQSRVCGKPIDIRSLTHRPNPGPAAAKPDSSPVSTPKDSKR